MKHEPKSITVNHLQIAYAEINPGAKNVIFFLHGNSGSGRTWHKQLADPALSDYRMIAFDLPAHGDSAASAKPEDDYNLPSLGHTMATAIKQLSNGNTFVVAGFSLGSNVLTEALTEMKPAGIVLTGSSVAGVNHTMDKIFLPGLDGTVFFSDAASAESIGKLAEDIAYQPSEADKQLTIDDYKRAKPGFRPAFIKTVMEGKVSDEIALMQNTGLPVLVVFGESEKMVNAGYLDDMPFTVWKNQIYKLPEAAHAVQSDQPAAFNALLKAYCAERLG